MKEQLYALKAGGANCVSYDSQYLYMSWKLVPKFEDLRTNALGSDRFYKAFQLNSIYYLNFSQDEARVFLKYRDKKGRKKSISLDFGYHEDATDHC